MAKKRKASRRKKASRPKTARRKTTRRRSKGDEPDPLNIAMGVVVVLLIGLLIYFSQIP